MTTAIVKYQQPLDVDALILAYWLMFCRCPRRADPDVDGSFDLGEIGADRPKMWRRLTPYSIACSD